MIISHINYQEGGEGKGVMIAMVLACEPGILLADEPKQFRM